MEVVYSAQLGWPHFNWSLNIRYFLQKWESGLRSTFKLLWNQYCCMHSIVESSREGKHSKNENLDHVVTELQTWYRRFSNCGCEIHQSEWSRGGSTSCPLIQVWHRLPMTTSTFGHLVVSSAFCSHLDFVHIGELVWIANTVMSYLCLNCTLTWSLGPSFEGPCEDYPPSSKTICNIWKIEYEFSVHLISWYIEMVLWWFIQSISKCLQKWKRKGKTNRQLLVVVQQKPLLS